MAFDDVHTPGLRVPRGTDRFVCVRRGPKRVRMASLVQVIWMNEFDLESCTTDGHSSSSNCPEANRCDIQTSICLES